MALADIIKDRRKALGYTLLDIANKVDVSEATVQRWESGNIKNLRQERIAKLAEVLEVSPAELMGWAQKEPITVSNDGLDPLDKQLMDFVSALTVDQKKFLLAQLQTMKKQETENPSSPDD